MNSLDWKCNTEVFERIIFLWRENSLSMNSKAHEPDEESRIDNKVLMNLSDSDDDEDYYDDDFDEYEDEFEEEYEEEIMPTAMEIAMRRAMGEPIPSAIRERKRKKRKKNRAKMRAQQEDIINRTLRARHEG